jgi:predicted nucleic acid-binding protein
MRVVLDTNLVVSGDDDLLTLKTYAGIPTNCP